MYFFSILLTYVVDSIMICKGKLVVDHWDMFIFSTQSVCLNGQFSTVRYGTIRYGMVRHGMAVHVMARHGMAWYGMVWYGMVWYGILIC